MVSSFSISPALVLVWVGTAQGFLLSLALVRSKRGSIGSNRALAALVFLLSSLVTLGIVLRGKELPIPFLYNVGAPFDFLFGPFLYFYFRCLLNGKVGLGSRDLVHFLPFLACILYLLPTYELAPAEKMALFRKGHQAGRAMGVLQCTSVIIYSVYSAVLYSKFKTNLFENFSNVDQRHLLWLKVLLYSYIGFGILGMSEQVLASPPVPAWFVPLGGSLVILGMGYIGHFATEFSAVTSEPQENTRQRKSGLKPELIGRYTKDLTRVMEVEKLFLDGNLSLQRLAKKMNIPSGQLSVLLNDHMNQKFFDFVNHYRIREAKRLMDSSSENGLNMLVLGFEVGFNSKSTFYSAFKKLEGCTPLAYAEKFRSLDV